MRAKDNPIPRGKRPDGTLMRQAETDAEWDAMVAQGIRKGFGPSGPSRRGSALQAFERQQRESPGPKQGTATRGKLSNGTMMSKAKEDALWADMERIRKAHDPTSESPLERFHREQRQAQRTAAHAHIHRIVTGAATHDGSPTTVLLLEVLRELRALKALVGKQPQ